MHPDMQCNLDLTSTKNNCELNACLFASQVLCNSVHCCGSVITLWQVIWQTEQQVINWSNCFQGMLWVNIKCTCSRMQWPPNQVLPHNTIVSCIHPHTFWLVTFPMKFDTGVVTVELLWCANQVGSKIGLSTIVMTNSGERWCIKWSNLTLTWAHLPLTHNLARTDCRIII